MYVVAHVLRCTSFTKIFVSSTTWGYIKLTSKSIKCLIQITYSIFYRVFVQDLNIYKDVCSWANKYCPSVSNVFDKEGSEKSEKQPTLQEIGYE